MDKCYCGYSYAGLCDGSYYKKGLDKGKVKPSIIKRHHKSGGHQNFINYPKKYNGVIRQLNCIIKNLFENETLLKAVIKNKRFHYRGNELRYESNYYNKKENDFNARLVQSVGIVVLDDGRVARITNEK